MIYLAITILLAAFAIRYLWPSKRKDLSGVPFPKSWELTLIEKVIFYNNLSNEGKQKFKERIKRFLYEVKINGANTPINDQLKVLVAASAIIPIFSFDEWEYLNLNEVLLYDGLVNTQQVEDKKNILGQVRPFQTKHMLLLSKQSLEKGFDNMNGKENVGIHEFAHLVDQADGSIDGLPKLLMPEELLRPWTQLMYKEIEKIKKGNSDINPYGLTNHGEFFAVVCEYFFENPEKFKEKHKELYEVLAKAFKRF